MKPLKRLDILFLVTGLFLLIPCLIFADRAVNINVHDTYFVISYFHIGILLFLIHALFGLGYFVMRKHYKYALGLLHLILGAPPFIYFNLTMFFFMGGAARRYYANNDLDTICETLLDSIYFISVLFVIAQLLFLTNIILSLVNVLKHGSRNGLQK